MGYEMAEKKRRKYCHYHNERSENFEREKNAKKMFTH
jgi:hypothetical protein